MQPLRRAAMYFLPVKIINQLFTETPIPIGLNAIFQCKSLITIFSVTPILDMSFTLKLLHIYKIQRRDSVRHQIGDNPSRTATHCPADVAMAAVPE